MVLCVRPPLTRFPTNLLYTLKFYAMCETRGAEATVGQTSCFLILMVVSEGPIVVTF